MASWYRKFIKDFAKIAHPLTNLLKKKDGKNNNKLDWRIDQENAFQMLKQQLIDAPMMHRPYAEKPYVLQTNASNSGLGAVLTQRVDDREYVIAYASRALKPSELINYNTTEKECLAVKWAVDKFRPYLES